MPPVMKHPVLMKAKMALIGDNGVGKTSLVRRFVLNEFKDEYAHTLGTKVSKIELVVPHGSDVEVEMKLSIFDIMGQRGFRDVVKETYFHGCQGLLAVCDVTREDTLESLHSWISSATEISGDVPIVIMVNKCDLKREARITEVDVEKLTSIYGSTYAFTSAKSGEFVDEAFNVLAVEIVKNAFSEHEARQGKENLKSRLLSALVQRGQLGLNKLDLFEIFKGMGYDEIQHEIQKLENEGLVRINWNGPADFSAYATEKAKNTLKTIRELPNVL